ncbi:helix-turn-helix domain-containing protein [Bacillus sp. FJAT-42315]|uniref:helix-turn-helix domain-containing protein n=1 Tax=Bacillus sp. FJAT-42315 TaxID=2014077 RepID=UPI000C23A972|nr:helix-turn-helix domain-containing protein [Bacillus sp. FJAT-42315]
MRKEWCTDEIEYLKEYVGFQKISSIAKKLDRSFESVLVKMNRLGLANTKSQTGLVTLGELSKILQVDRNTIKWWMKKHHLPFIQKVTRKSKSFYFIDPCQFWKWAEIHKEKITFSNIPYQALPPEPAWVKEERIKEKENQLCKKRTYKCWTTKEDQRLIQLRQEGLTYAEIGRRMNRSVNSIIRRYERVMKEVEV